MNPRVSRSSALASKATGFPIAKIAAKLAVGYTLDEIPNDITKKTPASFEPTIDYCVVKVPRFTFEKFKGADETLTVSMKSVGEAMAIGRTFKEALQKGLPLPGGRRERHHGRPPPGRPERPRSRSGRSLSFPTRTGYSSSGTRLKAGMDIDEIYALSKIDKWFLKNIEEIVEFERELEAYKSDLPIFSQERDSSPKN